MAVTLTFRDRIAALTPRERVFLAAGFVTLVAFLLYLLIPGEESSDVELAAAPPPDSAPVFTPPATVEPIPQPLVTPPPAPASVGAAGDIVLRGVMGGGPRGGAAIFALPGGTEQVVRVGREIAPGMVLRGIGVRYAIASSGGGNVRFELNKPGATAIAAPAPAPSSPTGASAGAPTAQRETLQYRLGLEPEKVDGRIRGFTIRPDAALPVLQRAGLRPGDTIVAVNGQAMESEEKVLELSREIAGAYTAEFEFIRDGKRQKSTLEVNKRPGS